MDKKNNFPTALIKFLILIAILAAGIYLGYKYPIDLEPYKETFRSYPIIFSGSLFILIYVISTTLVLVGPHDVLKISSAILFGAQLSTLLLTIAELINATILFALSRFLGREFVEKKFKWNQRKSMYEPQRDPSFIGILALRLNPFVPFRFMDIGYGLTTVRFYKYFTAILIASPFRLYWLQSIIEGIGENIFKDFSAVSDYMLNHPMVVFYSLGYFLVVIVLSVIALIVRARRIKAEKENTR